MCADGPRSRRKRRRVGFPAVVWSRGPGGRRRPPGSRFPIARGIPSPCTGSASFPPLPDTRRRGPGRGNPTRAGGPPLFRGRSAMRRAARRHGGRGQLAFRRRRLCDDEREEWDDEHSITGSTWISLPARALYSLDRDRPEIPAHWRQIFGFSIYGLSRSNTIADRHDRHAAIRRPSGPAPARNQ